MKRNLFLLVMLSHVIVAEAQSIELVYPGYAQSLSSGGSKVYFTSYDTIDFKYRPYVTSGSPTTTSKLNNCICQYYQGSPSFIATTQDVYFACDDSIHGAELWASNGTPSSTRLVKDLTPGTNSNLTWLTSYYATPLGNKLIFGANTGTDYELWTSDGTTGGTTVLSDLISGNGSYYSSSPSGFYTVGSKAFFFAGKQTFSNSRYLYLTDGTAANTNRMNDLSFTGSVGMNALVRGNSLLFSTADNTNTTTFYMAYPIYEPGIPYKYFNSVGTGLANTGVDLMLDTSLIYTSFKLGVGMMLLRQNMNFQITDTLATNLIGMSIYIGTGKKTFFLQGTSNFQQELWSTDGTKAGTIKLITMNQSSFCQTTSSNAQPVVYKDKIYFLNCDSIHSMEIWVSDGTVAGTHFFCEGAKGNVSTSSDQLLVSGNYLYFNGMDENYMPNLWRVQIDTGSVNSALPMINHEPQNDLFIYPNPASEHVFINTEKSADIIITAINGKLVKHMTIKVGESIGITELNDGVYFLQVDQMKPQKLVVLKK